MFHYHVFFINFGHTNKASNCILTRSTLLYLS